MQKYSVIVTATAEFEIDEYFDFIALDSLPNAIAWHTNIYDKIGTLSVLAPRCPIADENPFFESVIHCLLIDGYRALYRIEANVVEVLHVKHPRMNR
jgi:plasmid stabilization system protein ParE